MQTLFAFLCLTPWVLPSTITSTRTISYSKRMRWKRAKNPDRSSIFQNRGTSMTSSVVQDGDEARGRSREVEGSPGLAPPGVVPGSEWSFVIETALLEPTISQQPNVAQGNAIDGFTQREHYNTMYNVDTDQTTLKFSNKKVVGFCGVGVWASL
jgi:hypothetical protein